MKLSPRVRNLYTTVVPKPLRKHIESAVLPAYPKEYDEKRIIFIHIPKTAGKSIISKFHSRGARHLTYADYEKILGEKIREYFVFTVVRDPFSRFFSAFNYLQAGGNQSREDRLFAKHWIKGLSIDDFIESSFTEKSVRTSPFFCPQVSFLKDLDGRLADIWFLRFETLQNDFAELAPKLNVSPELPRLNISRARHADISTLNLHVLRDFYREDYELIESLAQKQGLHRL